VRDAGGVFTAVDIPRATSFTIVFGVNNSGDTVGGYVVDARGRRRAFLQRDDNTITRIDFPGAMATFASRINDAGHVVGMYSTDDELGTGHTPILSVTSFVACAV
jgi:uncharacterized membrane protein